MFIKTKISASIHGSINQHDNVKALQNAIDEQFEILDKAFASILVMKFSSLRLTSVRGLRQHIMQIMDIIARLKNLEVEMFESFLLHYILNTLSQQYGLFKISYNNIRITFDHVCSREREADNETGRGCIYGNVRK